MAFIYLYFRLNELIEKIKWVAGLISVCVSGGAIWWVLARYRPTWSDVSSTLAPSVSGRLLGYTWYLVPGCCCPAWQYRHIFAVLRDSSLWLSVVFGLRLSDLNKETTLLFPSVLSDSKYHIVIVLTRYKSRWSR